VILNLRTKIYVIKQMKSITKVLMLAAGISLFAISQSNAQAYVHAIPRHKIVTARPPKPSPNHVWLTEEWMPYKNTYRYFAGYWTVPPQKGLKWIPGKWEHSSKGYKWIKGRWVY
jgi:hypothetical protein